MSIQIGNPFNTIKQFIPNSIPKKKNLLKKKLVSKICVMWFPDTWTADKVYSRQDHYGN